MIKGYSDWLEEQANLLFGNVAGWEASTLQRIGSRISRIGKMSLADVKAINNIAFVKQDMDIIIKELAAMTNKNIGEMYDIYSKAISRIHEENKPLYDYRGKKFVAFEDNRELQALVRAYAKTTGSTMINLAKTSLLGFTAKNGVFRTLENTYAKVLDKAVIAVTSGATDFHTAMRDSIVELGGSGIRVNYGSGITRRLDTVVRQNLLWGAKQASVEYDTMIGDELGCDGIEIDWHSNPRPSHEFMQGKQYALGKAKTVNGVYFESADKALSALQDYGCLHYKTSIICGVSEPRYDSAELARLNEQNRQTYIINGKEMSGYEASQAMRRLEAEVRNQKDIRELAKSSGDMAQVNKCNAKIKAFQSKYNEISEITGIAKDPKRMSIPKIEKNSQKNLTKSGNRGIINKKDFNSIGDPIHEIFGSGEISHPDEIKAFREEIKKLDVELIEHETEHLGYSPAISRGNPGTLYISKGASYGAWCHEIQHMRDDYADGWSGMRILRNLDKRYIREKKAYQIEIDIAQKANRPDIVKRLMENLEKERQMIYGI